MCTKGLVTGTCPTNGLQEALVWICGTTCRDQIWSLQLDFEAEMASSHDGTCPHNLLKGLAATISPLVCADLNTERWEAHTRLNYIPVIASTESGIPALEEHFSLQEKQNHWFCSLPRT